MGYVGERSPGSAQPSAHDMAEPSAPRRRGIGQGHGRFHSPRRVEPIISRFLDDVNGGLQVPQSRPLSLRTREELLFAAREALSSWDRRHDRNLVRQPRDAFRMSSGRLPLVNRIPAGAPFASAVRARGCCHVTRERRKQGHERRTAGEGKTDPPAPDAALIAGLRCLNLIGRARNAGPPIRDRDRGFDFTAAPS